MVSFTAVIAIATFFQSPFILAHPGHSVDQEIARRAAFLHNARSSSLNHCASQLQSRSAEMIAHRQTMVQLLRKRHRVFRRDFNTVLKTDHHSNLSLTPHSPDDIVFGGNNTCVLQPETTEGPYWVSGEYVRKDITNGNPGVPLTFDVQLIDTKTCLPLREVALEAWHCNSTGVYGGVVAGGNGNQADAANINNTMFRGIQFSNENGILQFETTFPGHYTGRTTHIHVLAHINATLNPSNATLIGGHISHVGQLFFDQSLINAVEQVAPYATNKQTLMLNANDGIFSQEAATSDPVLNYVWLGEKVEDGIFGWVTVGLDPSYVTTPRAAAYIDQNGGHANAGGGVGPGRPPPSGGFPAPTGLQ